MSQSTTENKNDDVHHSLKGPHVPGEDNHESVAQRFEALIESTKDDHESHVGVSEVGGLKEDKSSLDKISGYFKKLGCSIIPNSQELDDDFVYYKMGNYVVNRNASPPNDRFFESMPIYVRIGMHLLFYSSKKKSLLRFGRIEDLLKKMSEREGEIYNDSSKPEEVQAFIQNFVKTYSIETKDLEEQDLTKYKTRNEFFYRKLKPDVRPIPEPENTKLIGSAADCRLMVFNNAEDAKKIWIKGRQFSVKELINKKGEDVNKLSEGSSIAIYRLAPADYHRYHHPVGASKVISQTHSGEEYYTVNPDAVNENFDVFTANTRDISMLEWTPIPDQQVIPFAFVSIGALLVGSNVFTNATKDSSYKRGEEMGYFAYGGSTCIAIFPPEAKVKWDDDLLTNSNKGVSNFSTLTCFIFHILITFSLLNRSKLSSR